MKRLLVCICMIFAVMAFLGTAEAISLYVDSGPNVYGSPGWASWKQTTYDDIVAGTMNNMRSSVNSANIGTTNFDILDEVVYSFGDLGRRLHWFYWVPDETVASLSGRFAVSLTNIWGDDDPEDFYNSYYGQTWLEPGSWENYAGGVIASGVIGSGGMAWWGAYGVNTQEALDADVAEWIQVDETWIFTARLDGVETSITSNRAGIAPIPEPGTMLLLGIGLAGLVGFRKKLKI